MDRQFGNRNFRGPSRGFDNDMTPPVNVGDVIDVKIEAVGEKGDGIAKQKGFILFIPNTKEGDNVKIKVTKVLRKVGFAEVVGQGSTAPAGEEQQQEQQPQEEKQPIKDTEDFGEEGEQPKESEEKIPEPPEYSEESGKDQEEDY